MGEVGAAWAVARPLARLRAWTGLVLMAYTTTHLANHALGIVSFDLMRAAHRQVAVIWHTSPGEALLLASLVIHVLLALVVVARSASLSWPRWQWLQLGLGLGASVILAQHIAATARMEAVVGANADYAFVLRGVWPDQALVYAIMLIAIWAHGCIGLHYWWRIRRWYVRTQPALLVVALLLPALAIGGMAGGGRDVAQASPEVQAQWAAAGNWPSREEAARLIAEGRTEILAVVFGGLVVAIAIRIGSTIAARRRTVQVVYPSGHTVRANAGLTLLEMSRAAGVPHAAVCGGRARCSTCRVRVTAGLDALPPSAPAESRLLERLGSPEAVRLACQIRPTSPISVLPLVAPPAALADARAEADPSLGREREIAVLFCDLRGFTQLSEKRLPYDLVYILNQYFRAMGQAIDDAGGHVDKVLGDGVMALFGIDGDGPEVANNALRAAASMSEALERLNDDLAGELDTPLRLAIGLHLGPAVVGVMGHGAARQLTAIGDTVNVASRLETLAKQADAQLAVSDVLLRRAGIERAPDTDTMLRGRGERLPAHIYPDARTVLQPTAEPA